MFCIHCGEETHVPDHKTGLIHKTDKYACYDGKRRLETVAETDSDRDILESLDLPEYSGAI